jgi:hypothetical protein
MRPRYCGLPAVQQFRSAIFAHGSKTDKRLPDRKLCLSGVQPKSDQTFCSATNASMCHSLPNASQHDQRKKKDRQLRRSLKIDLLTPYAAYNRKARLIEMIVDPKADGVDVTRGVNVGA